MPFEAFARAAPKARPDYQRAAQPANDNARGGTFRPANDNAIAGSVRIGRASSSMWVPRPIPAYVPFSVSGDLLNASAQMYVQAIESGWQNHWTLRHRCRDWSGTGYKAGDSYYGMGECNSVKYILDEWWDQPAQVNSYHKGNPGVTTETDVALVNMYDTAPGGSPEYDALLVAEGWYRLTSGEVPFPYSNGSRVNVLPDPWVNPAKARPSVRKRCGGQPSARPWFRPMPDPSPDMPPFVDAASAREAGYSPRQYSTSARQGQKPKFRSNKGTKPRKPKPEQGEGKSKARMGKGFGQAWAWLNKATEGADWVDAAFDALPEYVRDEYPNPTLDEKIEALANHHGEVDPSKFASNVVNNAIEDWYYGTTSVGPRAYQATGMRTGMDRALNAPRKVEGYEDDPPIPTVEINFTDCSINVTW